MQIGLCLLEGDALLHMLVIASSGDIPCFGRGETSVAAADRAPSGATDFW